MDLRNTFSSNQIKSNQSAYFLSAHVNRFTERILHHSTPLGHIIRSARIDKQVHIHLTKVFQKLLEFILLLVGSFHTFCFSCLSNAFCQNTCPVTLRMKKVISVWKKREKSIHRIQNSRVFLMYNHANNTTFESFLFSLPTCKIPWRKGVIIKNCCITDNI